MKLWQAAYWGEAAVGFHWFAIMFSLERCFRGSDKKTHQLMCVFVCVWVFVFFKYPTTLHPASRYHPHISPASQTSEVHPGPPLPLLFPPSLPLLLLPVTIYVWRRLQSLLFLSSPSLSPLCHTIPQSLPLPLLYSCPPPDTPSPSALLHV